jgi:lipopolysaccharide export system protein LptC
MNADPIVMRRAVDALGRAGSPAAMPQPQRARYGRGARTAKIILPLLALALAALIFVWSQINPVVQRLQISETEQAPEEIDSITMENARFAGIDARDRSFSVSAARAIQSADDSNRIRLQQPKADIVLANGAEVAIRSDGGGLQRDTQVLDLFGSVTLVQDGLYEFRTTQASIDLKGRTARGNAPIEGRGPQGQISAEGFEILDEGARVIFRGQSRAVLKPRPDRHTP